MSDDYEFDGDDEELFNSDFDDHETTGRQGSSVLCPECELPLEYRVEGRFVVRVCKKCGFEREE